MSLTHRSASPEPLAGVLKPRAGWLVLSLSVLLLLCLATWTFTQLRHDHWDKVAQAHRHVARNRPDLALELLTQIRDENPGASDGLTLAGRLFLVNGNVSTARRALERSLKIDPKQAEALKMLAAIYLASGDGRRGITQLESAAAIDPTDFRPWYAMAKVCHDLGELDKAASCYQEALSRQIPQREALEARIGRVQALLDAKRAESASEEMYALLETQSANPAVLAMGARHALETGRLPEAREFAERALAIDSRDFDALLARARVRVTSKDPEHALDDLSAALAVRPQSVAALQLYSQIQKRLGHHEAALQASDKAELARQRIIRMDQLSREITKRPDDPRPRWLMGIEAIAGEQLSLAFQCFQAAVDLDPTFQPARESLNELKERKGFDPRASGSSILPGASRQLSSR